MHEYFKVINASEKKLSNVRKTKQQKKKNANKFKLCKSKKV